MRKLVTLVSYLVLLWTWSLQGTIAEEDDDPDQSNGASALSELSICDQPPKTGPCKAYFRRYYYDNNSKTCKIFVYGGCRGNQNNFPTMSKCMQTCQSADACKQQVDPGQCKGYFERYFFNTNSMQCEPFIYGGCGGNQNNFESKKECDRRCHPQDGISLRIPQAPRKAEVCHLPPKPGPCKAYIRRFFYNSTSMKCEVFVYGGCDGNQNNFKNMAECKKACYMPGDRQCCNRERVASDDIEVCHLPPETGSCRMYEDRYFYNSTSMSCDRFVYGGCYGNQNNFKDKATCMHRCQPEEICNQPPETGQCEGYFKNFFYNSTSRSCEVFIYGGCGGNENRFSTKRKCIRTCQPVDADLVYASPEFDQTEVCNQPPQKGPCRAHLERYFYNPASNSCQVFFYGGCEGNDNNFKNQEQCMKACHTGDLQCGPEVFNKSEACIQPPETGPCHAHFNRYYYDSASMSCKNFIYGGCNGNQNNFNTNAECMQTCLPNEVCNQPPETGECAGYFQNYFYNSTSKNCEQFVYGGCGGNQNNFDTMGECMKTCH